MVFLCGEGFNEQIKRLSLKVFNFDLELELRQIIVHSELINSDILYS